MQDLDWKRTLREVEREPEDAEAWLALARLAARQGRAVDRETLAGLRPSLLMLLWRECPGDRTPMSLLGPLLGVTSRYGALAPVVPGRWWQTSGRLGTSPEGAYDQLSGLPLAVRRCSDLAEMRLVPVGRYRLGERRDARTELVGWTYLDRFPIRRSQYRRFLARTGRCDPSFELDEAADVQVPDRSRDLPIARVDLRTALDYAAWAGARIPLDSAWEAGSRGPDGATYPWGEDSPHPGLANFDPLGSVRTSRFTPRRSRDPESWLTCLRPLGNYPEGASPFGLEETCGTVAEWAEVPSPEGPSRPALLGGSWIARARELRPALRPAVEPGERPPWVGFRLAIPLEDRSRAPGFRLIDLPPRKTIALDGV